MAVLEVTVVLVVVLALLGMAVFFAWVHWCVLPQIRSERDEIRRMKSEFEGALPGLQQVNKEIAEVVVKQGQELGNVKEVLAGLRLKR